MPRMLSTACVFVACVAVGLGVTACDPKTDSQSTYVDLEGKPQKILKKSEHPP